MKRIFLIVIPIICLTLIAANKYVVVNDAEQMPWETIANPPGQVTNPVGSHVNWNNMNATNVGFLGALTASVYSASVSNLAVTNLQVTGGVTNGGILYSTNALGQLGMLGGLLANRKLFVNEAGTAPEYATGVATAELTISATNVSTTTAFVTLGFRPSSVLFLASNQGFLTQCSVGFSDAAGNAYCLYNDTGTTAGNWNIGGGVPMYLFASAGNSFYGLISSTATNGFTLTFTRTGTPTGSVRIDMLGFR